MRYLRKTCQIHDLALYPFGLGQPWHGDVKAHFEAAPDAIRALPSNVDLVLFTDAGDSLMLAGEQEIVRRFRAMESPVVLSAEQGLYPWNMDGQWWIAKDLHGESESPWRYPNGGGWMGSPEALLAVLGSAAKRPHPEAQGKWIEEYADNGLIRLDSGCQIFQTMSGPQADAVKHSRGKSTNTITGANPCVLHFNGKTMGEGPAYNLIYG